MSDVRAGQGAAFDGDGEARELLADLVAIPSVSGEEAECVERLRSFFEAHDREVWVDDAGNLRAPADDAALLTSHVDTVPGSIPVRTEEPDPGTAGGEGDGPDADGPVLYGRGSVDAKGSVAAMAVAAVRTGVSFAGVVGEETDSRGARRLVADREEPAALINGEPSGWDAYALAYRGFLRGTYRAETPTAHTSRPEPNGIQAAFDWWARVESALSELDAGSTFDSVTATPVAVEGGLDTDWGTVAARVEAEFRVPPYLSVEDVRVAVETTVDGGTIEFADEVPPVEVSPRTPVARALRAGIREAGGEPTPLRKTGTCDLNLYAEAWDCPMAVYGPGDGALDHAPNEHLPLADLDRATSVLEAVAERLQQ
jgi:LysW-gamma-L-lysine carboxypeptidase